MVETYLASIKETEDTTFFWKKCKKFCSISCIHLQQILMAMLQPASQYSTPSEILRSGNIIPCIKLALVLSKHLPIPS